MSTPSEDAFAAIQRFLKMARSPAIVETGTEPIVWTPECSDIRLEGGRLTVQAWDSGRNLARRVIAVQEEKAGRLQLLIEKFGKRTGTIEFLDLAAPRADAAALRATRLTYAERFRRSLLRQFPGWKIAAISTEADLEHSLSPAYPRAFLTKGAVGWAVLGAAPDTKDPNGVLSFALIWLDYLRRRERRIHVEGLALFLPEGRHLATCLRLAHLRRGAARWAVYAYGDGFEDAVDLQNAGNLKTVLPVHRTAPQKDPTQYESKLASIPGVHTVDRPDGRTSFRVRGLEFACTSDCGLRFGVDARRKAASGRLGEVEALARELSRLRAPEAPDHQNPLYTRCPELWFESEVRRDIRRIDSGLEPAPVYGQVPAFAGGERGVIDLLAADYRGRLAVVELKASEDLHLPLQALDYWIRVRWHVEQNDFSANGYFPGMPLVRESPRMLLVAPALCFHPTTETILRYFPSDLEVVRVGVAMNWQREFRIAFRADGASTPGE